MTRYVAFLRAINLGRARKVSMVDLRRCLEEAGLTDVETYIQTGNVRFGTSLRSREKVERYVEDALGLRFGFEVPAIVLTPAQLRQVYDDAVGLTRDTDPVDVRRYVTLLKADPPAGAVEEVDDWNVEGERATVVGRAVHWVVPGPSQSAKLSNARIEKALGVATTRDLKVIRTLADRWGGGT